MVKSSTNIILNFLHGNGPYLRTIELAIAVNDALEDKGLERRSIIVPLVYGDQQKLIMEENFGETIRRRPFELLFSEELGKLLKPILYSGSVSYEESLRYFLKNQVKVQKDIQAFLSKPFTATSFSGVEFIIQPGTIDLEISRCPQVSMGAGKSYYTGFDYISRVLKQALDDGNLSVDRRLFNECIPIYEDIESQYSLQFIAEPSIFSYLPERRQKYKTEVLTPPNTNQIRYFSYSPIHDSIEEGVYVTVTGIPGLEDLFRDLQKIGLRIYTHRPELIPGSIKAPPDVLTHPNIKFHFARSGWGSLWLSFMTNTPFIARGYHGTDDLEIYFNNKCIEHLGIGKVHDTITSMEDLDAYAAEYKKNTDSIKSYLLLRYGTLNGVKYTAEHIVDDFIKGSQSESLLTLHAKKQN